MISNSEYVEDEIYSLLSDILSRMWRKHYWIITFHLMCGNQMKKDIFKIISMAIMTNDNSEFLDVITLCQVSVFHI